jgi:primosomal protein N' (replication factor Y)
MNPKKNSGKNKEESFALICVDVLHAEVDRLFHYIIPDAYIGLIKKGMRVRVPFGLGNKPTMGYVMELTDDARDVPPEKLKAILEICEGYALFTDETLQLAEWMRGAYYTTLAACMRCVAPPYMKRAAKIIPRTNKKIKPITINLTDEQQTVISNITNRINKGETTPVLLHGVTSSGKTEVYLHVIEQVIRNGKDAIVLVPEIALTPQAVGVFTARFGDKVAVTHSRLSNGERFRLWKQALDGEIQILIGPRSAVFAPFANLGIIIIDEEHEHTYHSELSPKYDTRAVAIKRSELTGAAVILGSATPSLESYIKTEQSAYKLEKLTTRVNNNYPAVHIIDMRRELAEGNTALFARSFVNAMKETLAAGQQAILFLNRRGHSSFVSCRWCGHVLTCSQCRVNFTYHNNDRLVCHTCGHSTIKPKTCPACHSEYIRLFGTGTQKVEAEMAALFPEVVCLRMDMDTTRRKHGHAMILNAFKNGGGQVLIGTQMIAKGLDFPRVTLVGVLAADMSLYAGDFRSAEHTFQLLAQVSGRAGRSTIKSRVFIQTYNPEHYSIKFAQTADYDNFYKHEIMIRRAMAYPPFTSVFSVMMTGPDEKTVIQKLHILLAIMRYCNKKQQFDLLGISPAFISKVKQQYRWKLLVKAEDEEALKAFVLYCIRKCKENDPLTGITINLTFNPVTME